MQKTNRNLLSIIKFVLTDTPVTLDDELNYKELFLLSRKHQITPLIFDGLYKLKGEFKGMEHFKNVTFSLLFKDQNQGACLKQLEMIFSENGIDYMPLKGVSIKNLYPVPEFRLMGDLDILIKESQHDKIKELLIPLGYVQELESDHELIWKSKSGVIIELHKRLIPSYNDDYYSYYSKPWEKAVIQDNCKYSMTDEDEYIYIFTHLTKHYRDGGIGLRHMIDIWFFRMKHPSLDLNYISDELEKLELKEFHQNLLDTLDVWFNDKEETELSDYITERIITSGSFGLKEMHEASAAARASAKETSVTSAKKNAILKLIFLPFGVMKDKYPVLEKAPFLLPLMWVVRWIDAIFNKRKSIVKGANQINNLNAETVDSYNEELRKVGLKFSLKKE